MLKSDGNFNHTWVTPEPYDEEKEQEYLKQYNNDPDVLATIEQQQGIKWSKAVEQDNKGRFLYVTYDDPALWSNQCKTKCIDENKNYCTNSAFNGGICCDENEVCSRPIYCSFDNKRAPR